MLYMPYLWCTSIAFVLFLAGALTDWLDGYLARKYNAVTNFGKLIDALTDKIMVVGLFVTLLALEVLPSWSIFFVLLIIGREFLITGLRLVAASRGMVLGAEKAGKLKTVMQISSIGILILGYAMELDFVHFSWFPSWMVDFMYILGLCLFLIATYFTVMSAVHYMTKHWNIFMEDAG